MAHLGDGELLVVLAYTNSGVSSNTMTPSVILILEAAAKAFVEPPQLPIQGSTSVIHPLVYFWKVSSGSI